MWLLRFLAVLTATGIAVGVAVSLLTGDRRYLQLSWRALRYALLVALLVFALLILERVAVIPL
ncbi:MAG TPA: hypothetical protein PLS67_04970 [Accumulibacter sp.]|jgi:hypothetical protein|nr:hypothetical protein [Accumulibacter sp.]HQC79858.1 hypothetical protein [Accumulibacter sp.]